MKKNNVNSVIINFIKELYGNKDNIPLHQPNFSGNEKKYLNHCIESTYVSSVGSFVSECEKKISNYVGTKYAICTNSGTSALHISLLLANVLPGDEVITQSFTFVATCNAISYCNAKPIFVDIDLDTMGLSPKALKNFLKKNTFLKNGKCINKHTNKSIKACLPMHTYGHPCRANEIKEICDDHNLVMIEDAAEGIGSKFLNQHVGSFGQIGVFSFNGNKTITAGGGGCILTNNKLLADEAKHLTTTAKIPHTWNFEHDILGYNYRMPNLNAALLLAQLENLENFITKKRELASKYNKFFKKIGVKFLKEPFNCKSNYWLNSIVFNDIYERDNFLSESNSNGVMSRPAWKLMNELPMYRNSYFDDLSNSYWLNERIVNLPSSILL